MFSIEVILPCSLPLNGHQMISGPSELWAVLLLTVSDTVRCWPFPLSSFFLWFYCFVACLKNIQFNAITVNLCNQTAWNVLLHRLLTVKHAWLFSLSSNFFLCFHYLVVLSEEQLVQLLTVCYCVNVVLFSNPFPNYCVSICFHRAVYTSQTPSSD